MSAEEEGCDGQGDMSDKVSVASVATKTSRLSRLSIASKASRAASVLRKGLSFSMKSDRRNTTTYVAEMVNLAAGDMCETIAVVTVRRDESTESEVVAQLQVGTTLDVLAIGDGRRIKVGFGVDPNNRLEGWVSSKTKINEPLVMKCNPDVHLATMDFEVGGQHEVKALVTVRAGEDLDSAFVTDLQPGCRVRIVELGAHNKRRVKVGTSLIEGWISTATKFGEPLMGKVQEHSGNPSANLNITNSGSKVKSLLESARSGNLDDLIKVSEGSSGFMGMLTSKPSLNSSDVRGKTSLIYASAFGNKDVVKYLLGKREVDVNALDDTQKSALHHASKRAVQLGGQGEGDNVQSEIVNMLINAGASVKARDHNGCCALMFAVANGDVGVTQELLKAQAEVNAKDFEGHRPLDYAINFEHDHIAKLLGDLGGVSYDYVPGEETVGPGDADEMASSSATAEPDCSPDGSPEGSPEGSPGKDGDDAPTTAGESASVAGSIEGSPEGSSSSSPKPKKLVKKKASTDSKLGDASPEVGVLKPKAKAKKRAPTLKVDAAVEKKPKAKAKKKAGPSMAMMMEALGDDEDTSKELRVEEMATEDSDLKVRALERLNAVVESEGSPGELEAAIKVAQAEGVEEKDLVAAKQSLEALKERFGARDALRQRSRDRDVAGLKEAIQKAESLGLKDPELDVARKTLAEEEPRQRAREALQVAKDSGNPKQLKVALEGAKAAGLGADETAEFQELLAGAESKDKSQAALQAAMADKSVPQLKFSIQQAKEAGVDPAEVAQAEAILKQEEPKHLARGQLEEALEKGSKDALEAAIGAGKAAGLDASEPLLRDAEATLQKELEKERWLVSVNKALEETMLCNMGDIDSVTEAKKKLNTAIVEATKIGVSEKDLITAEVRRKKLHNTIEDLKGSIRVFCRIRPLSSKETSAGDSNICRQPDLMSIQVGEKPEHNFKFDAVFTPGTQDEIFEDCRDLVQSAVDGYNVTLFAYGQTGAGKTFTMAGVPGQLGISPRTIQEIFDVANRNKDRFEYTIMASMLELYRQELVDLLVKGNPAAAKNKLKIRDDKTGAVAVEHLTEEECANAQDLEKLVEKGTAARAVAATMMNSESSRSHLIIMIRIVGTNRETQEKTRGKILIVDLAGSERLGKSQTTGDAQKESIEINKSLTALGDVIEGLTQKWKVVPYRNHKLTMLMQDALGGSAKTLMFVNCSPANSNFEETVNSLKYAQRANNITNTVVKAGRASVSASASSA
mmetsp:Transcript_4059/g.15146  ORF Transcript_4059/g.15146 Transcript_4059/m.15146 type:complete len:1253 (-) Transcript_4059:32-3790(-)